ncbi:diguanylate cyclase [Mesorhizobium sp. M1409]|uniref:diguanylate cyclase domain-containing protein n=1 Tax=unclassified Mesorhizobium TaxID=325217 RepID=UPI003336B0DD
MSLGSTGNVPTYWRRQFVALATPKRPVQAARARHGRSSRRRRVRHCADRYSSPVSAAVLAGRLVAAMQEPFEVCGCTVSIGTSIGISVAPDDGLSLDELLRKADLALYAASMVDAVRSTLMQARQVSLWRRAT